MDLERELDALWNDFVIQVVSQKTRFPLMLMAGGIQNRCSTTELFFTFVLFLSVTQLTYLIQALFGTSTQSSTAIEAYITNKIFKDIAILFSPTSEKAMRRQIKFVYKTTEFHRIQSESIAESIQVQSVMYLFAQIKPLQELLFFLCSLYQQFTYKSVSQKQVDELIFFMVGKTANKIVPVKSLKPLYSTTDLIVQAQTLTNRKFLDDLRKYGILSEHSITIF